MLSITVLIEFIKSLQGIIPEAARSEVAHRLAILIADSIRNTNPSDYSSWVSKDRLLFFRQCKLADAVSETLTVEKTQLAKFCEKWLTINRFKARNNPTAKWRIITPAQNALRVTMIDELKSLDNSEK